MPLTLTIHDNGEKFGTMSIHDGKVKFDSDTPSGRAELEKLFDHYGEQLLHSHPPEFSAETVLRHMATRLNGRTSATLAEE